MENVRPSTHPNLSVLLILYNCRSDCPSCPLSRQLHKPLNHVFMYLLDYSTWDISCFPVMKVIRKCYWAAIQSNKIIRFSSDADTYHTRYISYEERKELRHIHRCVSKRLRENYEDTWDISCFPVMKVILKSYWAAIQSNNIIRFSSDADTYYTRYISYEERKELRHIHSCVSKRLRENYEDKPKREDQ